MKPKLTVHVKARRLFGRFGPLVFICQRTPVAQVIAHEARTLGVSGFSQVAKWTVSLVSGLGAFDCVSGATVVKQIAPTLGSATVAAPNGSGLNFIVQVTGAPSTAKSWKLAGTLPTGLVHNNATNSNTDSVTGIPRQNGNFPVTITAYEKAGYTGASKSATFTIIVSGGVTPPVISTQPSAISISAGEAAVLSVGASGAASFQWYQGLSGNVANPIAGATAASFTTPALTVSGSYWVRVANTGGSVNSATATVTVIDPPVLTSQPAAAQVNPGGSAVLTVGATGTSPSYQWYAGDSGDFSTPLASGTGPTFTTPALAVTARFWVLVRNIAGSVNSDTAVVTVTVPPSIQTQPVGLRVAMGLPVTLSVAASGTSLAYQWYCGAPGDTSQAVLGADGPSLTVSALGANASYWVNISNGAGWVHSEAAVVQGFDTFSSWAAGRFTVAQLEDPLISGAGQDPDADGLTNEQEFVYGTPPLTRNGSLALAVTPSVGPLSFSFQAAAASGVGYVGLARHYAVESSPGLGGNNSWTTCYGFLDLLGLGQSVLFAAPGGPAASFYRVRVWLAPE